MNNSARKSLYHALRNFMCYAIGCTSDLWRDWKEHVHSDLRLSWTKQRGCVSRAGKRSVHRGWRDGAAPALPGKDPATRRDTDTTAAAERTRRVLPSQPARLKQHQGAPGTVSLVLPFPSFSSDLSHLRVSVIFPLTRSCNPVNTPRSRPRPLFKALLSLPGCAGVRSSSVCW